MKNKLKKWAKQTILKAVKTMAETALGVIGASAMITAVDWRIVLWSVALSGIVTVLINIKDIPEVE